MANGIEDRFNQFNQGSVSDQPQQLPELTQSGQIDNQTQDTLESRFAAFEGSNPQLEGTGSFGQVLPRIDTRSEEDKTIDGIAGGFLETVRGFYEGTESVFQKLDGMAKLINNSLGVEVEGGGIFDRLQKQQKAAQDVIPETDVGDISKTIFNVLGSSPSIIAEFAAVPTGKLSAIPSMAAKMGLLQGLKEYEEEESLGSLGEGAIKGAATGAAFGVGGKVLGKGIGIMQKFGKKTAKAWIKLTTGDAKLAQDFVNNPRKYNVNPFGKSKSNDDIISEFKGQKEIVEKEALRKMSNFKDKQLVKKEDIRIASNDAKISVRDAQNNAKEALQENSRINIEKVIDKSNQAIAKNNAVLKDESLNIFEEAAGKLKLIKERHGKEVAIAVRQTIEENPGTVIKGSNVLNRVRSVINKESPFKVERGKASPRTAASGDKTDITVFNNIFNEIRNMSKEGFPIQYLQDLKVGTKDLASKAFKAGNNKLGQMYSEMSSTVNPANIVQRDPKVAKALGRIAEANKKFSSMIPKYEEAMKNYFVKDAQGNFVPDYSKAINAIKNNNKPVIRQMRKADNALPPGDQILPKITKLVRDMERANIESKSLIKLARLKAQQQKRTLLNASKEATTKLNKSERKISFEKMKTLRGELNSFKDSESVRLNKIINELEKQEKFLLSQNALNQVVTQGKGFIPTVQRANIFGVVAATSTGNPALAIPAAVNVGLLSPKVAATVAKPFLQGGGVVADKAKQAVQNDILKQLLAGSSLRQNN